MNFMRVWEDLNAWSRVGLCAVAALIIILLIVYVF
jgi:hypothetical protein